MKRKSFLILIITVALFYSFIYYLSRGTEPLFFMGTGWRFYKLEDKRIVEEIKITDLKERETTFYKDVKFYPECTGLIHEDIKERLLSFSFDSYLFIPLKLIVPKLDKGDSLFVEIEEEIIKGDAINYIFGFPVRIERIELKKPVGFKGVRIKRGG